MCTVHHYDMIVSNWIRKTNTNKPKGNYSCSYIHFFYARNRVYFFEKKSVVVYSVYRFFFLAGLWKFRMNRLLHIFRTICRPIKMIGIYWCWHQHFKSQVFPYNRLIITAFAKLLFGFAIAACSLTGIVYRSNEHTTIEHRSRKTWRTEQQAGRERAIQSCLLSRQQALIYTCIYIYIYCQKHIHSALQLNDTSLSTLSGRCMDAFVLSYV